MQRELAEPAKSVSIAFLADERRFGYHLLGGSESYVRRLAWATAEMGNCVRYVQFNASPSVTEVAPNCILHQCRSLRDALNVIEQTYATDVVTVSIGPIEELRYARFRRKQASRIRFHRILFGEQARGLKKLLLSTAHRIAPYNGATFALTERAMATLVGARNYLFRPPVPDSFYVSPADKGRGGPLKVVFVGRLDPEKGINEVLDLSRVEAGRIDLNPESVDLGALVSDCIASIEPLVKPGVEMRQHLDRVPFVRTDSDRIRRVVMNLLGNAVKFTESGSITVSLRSAGAWRELAVADTGVGIPPEDLPHIFEEFHQVERQVGEKREGTGLGLAIAGRSVEMLGGTISAESEVGQGTTFTVRISDYSDPPANRDGSDRV